MSPTGVGLAFSILVLSREGYHLWRPWRQRRVDARAECERFGHVWGKEFTGMGVVCRNCERCKKQEHRDGDGDWA